MSEEFYIRQMPNGLTLLGQRMDEVSSAALCLALPAGAARDKPPHEGAAAIACEWLFRGAGDRDTRRLHDALDSLGCQHHEDVHGEHMLFSTVQLGRSLQEVLALYADIIRRPRLEDATFEPCRALIEQDLSALEDEPARKCNLLLRERFFPHPLERCLWGTPQSLAGMTPEAVRGHVAGHFAPQGAILSVAGNVDWQAFCETVERLLGDWSVPAAAAIRPGPAAGGITQIRKESAQAHIGLAHAAPVVSGEQYYAARVAAAVLSGGMSSRLFTEVREKRGLVYHVSTRYHSLRKHAGMLTYAGAVPGKAQETLEVTVGELRRLADGIEEDEMTRARTQLKSALVMQGESTTGRANALVNDWYHLQRLRSLQEVCRAVDEVTVSDVLGYLRDWPAAKFTILTIGPEPLDTGAVEA